MSRTSVPALRVLLAIAEQHNDRPGWTTAGAIATRLGADPTDVWPQLSHLDELGYCVLSAHGPCLYVTPAGADLARSTGRARGEPLPGPPLPGEPSDQALSERERYYRTLIENTHDVITILGDRGEIRYASPSARRVLGYLPEDLVGQRYFEFVHPADVEEARLRFQEALSRPREPTSYDIRVRHAEGGWRVLDGVAVNLLDDPALRGVVAHSRDATEARVAREEREAYARELERSNRDLQAFAYVASHDLQEPLRKIQTFGDFLAAEYGPALGEEGQDFLRRMHSAAARMRRLIDDLLAFARVATQPRAAEPVELREVVEESVADLDNRLRSSGGRVEVEPLPRVVGDRSRLRQLFHNLLANGLKFHRPDLPPVVTVSGERGAGGWVTIRVRDNGVGFDPAFAQKIFEPFQRLHARLAYEGTGMGLAICRTIAERHGGTVTAYSIPGEGATFEVTLPAAAGNTE